MKDREGEVRKHSERPIYFDTPYPYLVPRTSRNINVGRRVNGSERAQVEMAS